VTALGGAPVAMPMGEAYDAISRGVAEGYIGPYEALAGFKLAEVIKCTTENLDTAYVGSFFVVMNKKKWDSLSQENQKIIEKINEEWIGKTGTLWDELDKEGKELTLKRGNKIIALSKEENAKWRKAVDPIIDEYVKSLKSKGLPGEEAVQYLKETIKSFK
jgi:TRAP-type C4-dicarboxylate transport system substrate-binding protein